MKLNLKIILAFCILFGFGCSHAVYKMDTTSENLNLISDDVTGRCEDKCDVDTCWMETQTLTVCNVQFTSLPDSTQKRVLSTSSAALKEKGLNVGFCGHDSNTKQKDSVTKSTGSGTFSDVSGRGGSMFMSGGLTQTLTNQIATTLSASDEKAMQQACHSRPVDK